MSETALHNLKKDLTQSSVANIIIICEKTILFQLFCKKKNLLKDITNYWYFNTTIKKKTDK